MDELLFVAYLFFFCWLVTRLKFFKASGLSDRLLICLFLLKVSAGIFYGMQGMKFSYIIQMGDTWSFHKDGLKQLKMLREQPLEFLTNIFYNNYDRGYTGFLSSRNSWWNDLHTTIMMKLLAVFDLFSHSNYYINVIFYSFLTFFGPIAIYRVMKAEFKTQSSALLFLVFLLPSFLYWTSGIHKDGFAFLGIGLAVFYFHKSLSTGTFTAKSIFGIFLGFFLLLAFRNYLLVLLLPALLTWYIAEKHRKALSVFAIAYVLFATLFFVSPFISAHLNLPQAVVEKQEDFMTLKGNSYVPTIKLEPNFKSFALAAPHALGLSLLRPFPTDGKHLNSIAAAIEISILLFFLLLAIIFRKPDVRWTPFACFCLFFALTVFLVIGYTVNFMGAIVRYRSILFPFLTTPLLLFVDWKRFRKTHYK